MRYLKIFWAFTKNNWLGEIEFRFNFIFWIAINIFWGLLSLVFVELIFGQVTSIAGWNKDQVLVLACLHIIFSSFIWVFIMPNVTRFSQLIRKGDLDFVLTKPINSRFWVSSRVVEFSNLPRLVIIPFVLSNALRSLSIDPTWLSVFSSGLLLFFGLVIFYNLFFLITSLNIWFTNIFNLENLFDSLNDIGRFPISIFKGLANLLLIYIIPAAFVATFPAQALLGRGSFSLILLGLVLAVVTFWFSQKFWHFALRHYSSASS